MFKQNSRYEIKTPNGYEEFSGIQKIEHRNTLLVILEDGNHIDVTPNHKFKTPFGFTELSKLCEGDLIDTQNGFQKICKIELNDCTEDVFDVINAGKEHSYFTNGILSHNCEFIGSANTLIHPTKLQTMRSTNPIRYDLNDCLAIYEYPKDHHTYVMTVDVAEGQGNDYSAFSVMDVTQIPYKMVARYRNNKIAPMLFPTEILKTAMYYKEAYVLVEINSIGLQVASILHFELGYDNLIKVEQKGKQGQKHIPGFKKKVAYGLKVTAQTKMIGCANLKTIIENDKLIIPDWNTIQELMTFTADKKSFNAEEGKTDDLVMTLVNFGWLTSQKYFKESIFSDIRKAIETEQSDLMNAAPIGFIDDGLNSLKQLQQDDNGDVWIDANLEFDEFGNMGFGGSRFF